MTDHDWKRIKKKAERIVEIANLQIVEEHMSFQERDQLLDEALEMADLIIDELEQGGGYYG